ncbi:MAG: hypothetical protein QME64_06445 [bacterium]|nr:hypothetical protein [bacterium]
MKEYDKSGLVKKVIAIIPAAGTGSRMTPRWTINNPFLDALAKPAMTELSSGKAFLDLIFDTLLGQEVVNQILLRVGHRPQPKDNCVTEEEKIKYKLHSDLTGLARNRGSSVVVYYSNPDGRDDGTGATVVAREAKEFLRNHPEYEYILILASDIPTIPAELFKEMLLDHIRNNREMTIASVIEEVPFNYGRIVRQPQTNEFIAVVEQSQIGKTKQEREGALSFPGLSYPLPKEYLHQIKERNVLLEVINRDIFLNAIRDIDAPNYGRVIRDEQGNELGLIENADVQKLPENGTYVISGKTFKKQALMQIRECRKIIAPPPDTYVLERHKKNEYYLPELAREVKAQKKKVGIFPLPKGTAQGFDSRTDIRYYASRCDPRGRPKASPEKKSIFNTQLLQLLPEREFQVLEQVFAITVYPDVEIYVDNDIHLLLTKLAELVIAAGGAKEFCERYFAELKSKQWAAIPGLEKFTKVSFAIGVHSILKGQVGFAGSISIAPWVTISNCLVQNSELKRNQVVENKLIINNLVKEVAE